MWNHDLLNEFFIRSSQYDFPLNSDLILKYMTTIKPGITHELNFKEVNNCEIERTIQSIKSNSCGVDGINLNVIKLCCPFIIPEITHIINACITGSVYPQCWKRSTVLPIPKVTRPSSMSNMRPINILPTMSKIFEKVISIQLRKHLQNQNILPYYQSGFRPMYGCDTALACITDDIHRATDAGCLTILVSLDLSRAFDTVNHRLMVSILHHIGLGNSSVKLMENYLHGRTQCVKVGNESSRFLSVRSGVPQGSIIGPDLFSIYTSFLPTCLKTCKYHFYADDTVLYFSFPKSKLADAVELVNADLDALATQLQMHFLKFNPDKSQMILFGNRGVRDGCVDFRVRVGNANIQRVDTVKILGIVMDADMRFTEHVNRLLRVSYGKLKTLYPVRQLLNTEAKLMLCDSLILSVFNHCDMVYGPCLRVVDAERIQRVQKSCLRLVYGITRRQRISHKLLSAGWLSMSERRTLHFASRVQRILLLGTPPYLCDRVSYRTDIHHLNLRHRSTLTIPEHRTESFKRSFSYVAAKILNDIPFSYSQYQPIVFKQKFKKILLDARG